MPTGYTAQLMEHGQSFEDFVMLCTRAMGVCVAMRDDPMNAPIPKQFEPSDYHLKAQASALADSLRLEAMNPAEAFEFGEAKKQKQLDSYQSSVVNDEVQTERLREMELKVTNWTPPTKEHQGLKDFMLEQLRRSNHDYSDFSKAEIAKIKSRTPMEFYAEAVSHARDSVAYHEKHYTEEVQRTEDRNKWLKDLRGSLKQKEAA